MDLRFRREALADLQGIYDHISEHDPAVAVAVIRRIRSALQRLEHFPHSGRAGTVAGTRELVVTGLP